MFHQMEIKIETFYIEFHNMKFNVNINTISLQCYMKPSTCINYRKDVNIRPGKLFIVIFNLTNINIIS